MTLAEYQTCIKANGFIEEPIAVWGGMVKLEEFVNYEAAEVDLKIYLTEMVLKRNFSPVDGHMVLTEQFWLLEQFLEFYKEDHIRPWLTDTIREAMSLIGSKEIFTKCIFGTTFMFGVIEFHAKYLLGWRPLEQDVFNNKYHGLYRGMPIGQAINKLKKTKLQVAGNLIRIDKYATAYVKNANHRRSELGQKEIKLERWTMPKIAERLTFYRNAMLHGESHGHYSVGVYLCMLYILFHLCDEKERGAKGESETAQRTPPAG
ncbi:hypothetical protein [Chitinophaga defluvii]|uniref:Cthe-2314-like HEPN domain-containing protein n=1 Tax=Chitinophaga defluvii TaxID=3163343 RepID=A0ABV2T8Q7_9BACT